MNTLLSEVFRPNSSYTYMTHSEFQDCSTIMDVPVHPCGVLPPFQTATLQDTFVLCCPPNQRVPLGNSRSVCNRLIHAHSYVSLYIVPRKRQRLALLRALLMLSVLNPPFAMRHWSSVNQQLLTPQATLLPVLPSL